MFQLIELATILKPSEIIAPDTLFSKDNTIRDTNRFIKIMKSKNDLRDIRIMAVPQGNNESEYLECYLNFLHNDNIDIIGISKIATPFCFKQITDTNNVSTNRRYLIKLLKDNNLIKKQLHLLGMRSITEYKVYNEPLIRSTDSCFTILAAIHGIKLNDEVRDDIFNTPEQYFKTRLTKEQTVLAKQNIKQLEKAIK